MSKTKSIPSTIPPPVCQKMILMQERIRRLSALNQEQVDKENEKLQEVQDRINEHVITHWDDYGKHIDDVPLGHRNKDEYSEYLNLIRERDQAVKEGSKLIKSLPNSKKMEKWSHTIIDYEHKVSIAFKCLPIEINWKTGEITRKTEDAPPSGLEFDDFEKLKNEIEGD